MAIKVFLRGGLGNQLFQYTAGLFLAQRQNEEVVFRSDLLPKYPDAIASTSRWPIQITEFEYEGTVSSRSNQPTKSTNTFSKLMQSQRFLGDLLGGLMIRWGFLSGERERQLDFSRLPRIRVVNSYCASSKPATELYERLRGQLLQVVNPSKEYLELISESRKNAPLVIHLRLGDYRHVEHLYGKTNFDQLGQVISRALASEGTPVWLFTDSPEELDKELIRNLKIDRVIGPKQISSSLENLILLSAGSALICSNSTFSWWAAFLKGPAGQVHYPRLKGLAQEVFRDEMVLWSWEPFQANRKPSD